MPLISKERAEWLARHALPGEPLLRRKLARVEMPPGLDADDVIQEIYAKLAVLDDTSSITHPSAYMWTMARNVIGMHRRRSKIVPMAPSDDFQLFEAADETPDPEHQVSDRQQLKMLATAVSELPERSRAPFLLRVMEDLPYREIGQRLGLSENAVQKNVARTLKFLADRLGRGGGNDGAEASNRKADEKTDYKNGDESD